MVYTQSVFLPTIAIKLIENCDVENLHLFFNKKMLVNNGSKKNYMEILQ